MSILEGTLSVILSPIGHGIESRLVEGTAGDTKLWDRKVLSSISFTSVHPIPFRYIAFCVAIPHTDPVTDESPLTVYEPRVKGNAPSSSFFTSSSLLLPTNIHEQRSFAPNPLMIGKDTHA